MGKGKAYSSDLRERVVAATASGRSCRDVSAVFDVAPSTAGIHGGAFGENSHAARPMGGTDKVPAMRSIVGKLAEGGSAVQADRRGGGSPNGWPTRPN